MPPTGAIAPIAFALAAGIALAENIALAELCTERESPRDGL